MAKKYKGSFPDPDKWEITHRLFSGWIIAEKSQIQNGWANIKVFFNGRITGRANYWLAWNGERLAEGREVEQMDRDHPDLRPEVTRILSNRSASPPLRSLPGSNAAISHSASECQLPTD